jgi:hypothetical protein
MLQPKWDMLLILYKSLFKSWKCDYTILLGNLIHVLLNFFYTIKTHAKMTGFIKTCFVAKPIYLMHRFLESHLPYFRWLRVL